MGSVNLRQVIVGVLTVCCVLGLFCLFVCFVSRVIPGVLSWVSMLDLSNIIMFLLVLEIVVIMLRVFVRIWGS